MTNVRDYMMVSDGDDAAGATVWWRLRGEFPRTALRDALLHDWPLSTPAPAGIAPHEPEVALRRAVAGLRSKRRLIRPVRRGVWAVITELVSADSLRHWTGPTISLDPIGRLVMKNDMGSVLTPEDDGRIEDLRKAYDHYLDALTTDDVSAWLITQVDRLGAVSMREGGGIYYLPPHAMREWRAIVELIQRFGNNAVFVVPTVRMTRDGARAILASLTLELETEVERLRYDIISGDLGVRALENRAHATAALLGKVDQYESILSTPMTSMRDLVNTLSADLTAAKLAAEAEDAS